jgi:hypothetical protein
MVGDDGSCVCRLRLESGPTQLGQGAAEACVVWVYSVYLGTETKGEKRIDQGKGVCELLLLWSLSEGSGQKGR